MRSSGSILHLSWIWFSKRKHDSNHNKSASVPSAPDEFDNYFLFFRDVRNTRSAGDRNFDIDDKHKHNDKFGYELIIEL